MLLPSPYLTTPPPEETGQGARCFWKRCRVLLCFAAGLFGVLGLLHLIPGLSDFPELEDKLRWLEKHGEQYDTIFLGTSRVHRQINPALFDQLMAQGGVPTRSFNLGVGAAYAPEDTLILELFLAQRRAPFRFFIVESYKTDPLFLESEDKKDTARARYWMKPRHFQDIFAPSLGLKQRYDGLRFYVQDFFLTGRSKSLFQKPPATPKDFNGWMYQAQSSKNISDKGWKDLQANCQEWAATAQWDKGSPEDQAELARKVNLLVPFGPRVFAIFPPLRPEKYFLPDPARHPGLTFFLFQDTVAYPELFQRENLADKTHLNAAGANAFTRRLAEEILKSLPEEQKRQASAP